MKKIIIVVVIVAALGAAAWLLLKHKGDGDATYEFAEVTRGNIESTVSCTGTLQATSTVEVGTQVSGTVDKVLVDYNDHVKVGQVLAVIDTTQLVLTVESSRADMKKAEASLNVARLDYQSAQKLREENYISEYELAQSQSSYYAAEASYISSKTSYEQNLNNLRLYSIITSPIDGIVIDRAVEPGTTVAASYSTPTLFTIAEDLGHMEIEAYIDESDIGMMTEDMGARFTVDAYPDEEFTGTVSQVRLQPETVNNVVNYIVIVKADNPDGKLLPGMTATVDFITESVNDVLTVPASALAFRPDTDTMKEVMTRKRAEMEKNRPQRPDSASVAGGQHFGPPPGADSLHAQGGSGGQQAQADSGSSQSTMGMLWYLNDNGEMDVMFVRTGSTDGATTQVSGPELKEGMQVITKQDGATSTDSTSSSSKTNNQNGLFSGPGAGGPPPGGGGPH